MYTYSGDSYLRFGETNKIHKAITLQLKNNFKKFPAYCLFTDQKIFLNK